MTCHTLLVFSFFLILSHFVVSWHICPDLIYLLLKSKLRFIQPGFSKGHLAVPTSTACGLASNYVDCIAALSDRTTKGLQGFHYTLSFLCKPGNKPPVSCSFRKPHRFLRKNASLFPEFLVFTVIIVKIKYVFKAFANWRARTIKIVKQYCKLCVRSCFDSFGFFVDAQVA